MMFPEHVQNDSLIWFLDDASYHSVLFLFFKKKLLLIM